MSQTVKNLPTMQESWVQSLGQEGRLKKGMATHSSILAWRIPWTESLVGNSPWGHKESDMIEVTQHARMQAGWQTDSNILDISLALANV